MGGEVRAFAHELALHNVDLSAMGFYHATAADAGNCFHTLLAGFGKLAGSYFAFGKAIALMGFYLHGTTETIVMRFGIRYIGTNGNHRAGNVGNAYAAPEPASIYQQCPAWPTLIVSPLCPGLQAGTDPCLPLKAIEEKINCMIAQQLWSGYQYLLKPGLKII